MRIVAGQYRGKKLYSPEGKNVRPTSERAREAVFNILNSRYGNDYGNFEFADIFAGTGAFGFEALSRGAKGVTLVDVKTDLAVKNAALFPKESEKIKIIRANALLLPYSPKTYDIIYIDAPYSKDLTLPTLKQLKEKNWAGSGTLCIAEIRNDEKIDLPNDFAVVDERNYGLAKILFLKL